MNETGEQRKFAIYPDNYRLSESELAKEGMGLIHDFYDLFKADPDAQKIILDDFFNENLYSSGGRSGRIGLEEIHLNKGSIEYRLRRTNDAEFYLGRIVEESEESLKIKIDPHYNGYLIDYTRGKFLSRKKDVRFVNRGSAVQAARELLAKTQKDFGRV